MNRALGITNQRAKQIESRFAGMNRSINSQFARIGGAFAGAVSLRGAQQLIDASTRIDNALKVAGLSGDELTRVYDRLFASAQKNAAPLESLVTLYGRAAIVQKELGVSTEELLGFTNNVALALRVAGTDAASASGALLQLSQALGSGVVRAEEFNSILEGALPIAQAAARGLEEAGGSVAKLRALVVDGKVSSEAFFRAFEAGASTLEDQVAGSQITVAQGFVRIYNAAIDAAGKINEGAQAGDRLTKSLNELADAIKGADFSTFIGGIVDTITYAKELAGWLNSINEGVQSWGNWIGSFGRVGGGLIQQTEPFVPSRGGPSSRGGPRGTSSASSVQTVSLGDFAPPAGSGKKKREDAWQRETRQIQEQTAALQLELTLIGQTEQARDKARAALELENAARRAGIELTPQHKAQIEELSTAYAAQAEAVRRVQENQERAEQAAQAFYDTFTDSIKGAITGANSFSDALSNILNKLADLALDSAFRMLFSPTTSTGGGLFGGIFSGIGSLFGFSSGTPNTGGNRGQVRGVVHGQEAVIPLPQGGKVPVVVRGQNGGAAPSGPIELDINVGVDNNGNLQAYVQRTSIESATVVVRQNNKSTSGRVAQDRRRFG